MDRDALLQTLRTALSGEAGVSWAYVFGSLARGDRFRDVDVALMAAGGRFRSVRDLGGIAARLSRQVSDVDVDIVDLASVSLPLFDAIVGQGTVVLDRDPLARRHWEAEMTSQWLDFRPTWEEQERVRSMARASRA